MKKTFLMISTLALVLLIGVSVFAAAYRTPAEIYGELAGIDSDAAHELKLESGKTFGELADEQGFLEAFEAANLENKLIMIEEKVADGSLSREDADAVIEVLSNGDCETPGEKSVLKDLGIRFGNSQMDRDYEGNKTGERQGNDGQFKNSQSNNGQGTMARERTEDPECSTIPNSNEGRGFRGQR